MSWYSKSRAHRTNLLLYVDLMVGQVPDMVTTLEMVCRRPVTRDPTDALVHTVSVTSASATGIT